MTTCSQVGQHVHRKAERVAQAQHNAWLQHVVVTRAAEQFSARQKRSMQMGHSSDSSNSGSTASDPIHIGQHFFPSPFGLLRISK
ncbi:MAG: hypothetical protein EOO40_11165 [Deltaproteobacteria bacterium]|nr:MAG: hypothetical protein EOO40_11165 [Deltaproteobacteria bacterium]